ncbi:DUF3515 domain-containing protein [Corynebacterium anserum]|uniref:DUF3515 family protein n=1 Tax=Corynebacterium anserum TaxID=2684406 RepID=A0A7G7YNY9_9CORY|nr:DUF3515 domain-containing protein [Corynebacterium anserum]MBC2681808.1 DUF3515 family protein [Corynebacterium anserum]QNH96209.1 DUF3515 family protein [Corynebacterium anserum]
MTKQASDNTTPRTVVILSLILAVLFVIAVLVGAHTVMERQTYTPVSMGPVDAPEAESQECSDYIDALPDKMEHFRAVGVMDPAPAGAAAFRDESGEELSVRCGVRIPNQYTVLSSTTDAGGATWFEIADVTPSSTMRTWYSVGSTPSLAITTSSEHAPDLEALGKPAAAFTGAKPQPGPYPLSDLTMVSPISDATPTCTKFLRELPHEFEGYVRTEREDAPQLSATYLSSDLAEPVVIRCGATLPKSYKPGEHISQVDSVAWFSDPTVNQGSTTGVWYALSHEQIVAVSMPSNAGNAVISGVSTVIEKTMKSHTSAN